MGRPIPLYDNPCSCFKVSPVLARQELAWRSGKQRNLYPLRLHPACMSSKRRVGSPEPTAFLPPIYPDELLHSFIGRVMHLHGWRPFDVRAKLFGVPHEKISSILLPTRLSYLAALFKDESVTADRLAWNHTFLPYLTAYRSPEKRRRLLHGMTSEEDVILGKSAFFYPFWPRSWKFCSVCHEEMLAEHGALYWRRSHQTWISAYCSDHKIPLKISNLKFEQGQTYSLPTEISCPENAEKMIEKGSTTARELLYRLSVQAQRLMNDTSLKVDRTADVLAPQRELTAKGFTKGEGKISWNRLRPFAHAALEQINEVFPVLLDAKSPLSVDKWLQPVVRGYRKPLPETFLLAKLIAETVPERLPFGKGPWPCLNPASDHHGKMKITRFRFLRRQGKTCVGEFECECGYTYVIGADEDGTTRPPQFKRFGISLVAAIAKAKRDELSVYDTARSLNMQVTTLLRAMKNEDVPIHWQNISRSAKRLSKI